MVSVRRALEHVEAFDVVGGPIVIAISGSVAGAKKPPGGWTHPIPAEWRSAMQSTTDIDAIVARVWPED